MTTVAMPSCFPAENPKRALCACGGRNAVRIVFEYIDYNDGSTQYAGGRFCYHDRAVIGMEIPADGILVQMSIYDIHEPDEIIRIDFHPKTPHVSLDHEQEEVNHQGDGKVREHAALTTSEPI